MFPEGVNKEWRAVSKFLGRILDSRAWKFSLVAAMNHAFPRIEIPPPRFTALAVAGAKEAFRQRFQCALVNCVRRGFSVEEAFGIIWEEMIGEIDLSYTDQEEMYPQLIQWAKARLR